MPVVAYINKLWLLFW